MQKNVKRIMAIALLSVVVLVVVALAVVKVVYLDELGPRIEKAASEATGLEVSVGGMDLDILPSLAVAAEDIRVKGETSEVLSADEVKIAVALGPLLSRRLEVTHVRVERPVINIVRGKDGRYNFEGRKAARKKPEQEEKGALPLEDVLAEKISIVGGRLTYTDEATGNKTAVKDFDINIKDVSVGGLSEKQEAPALLKSIAFRGDLEVGSFEAGNYRISDISSAYVWKEGVFDIGPMKFKLFGGNADGKCIIDLSGKMPRVQVVQDVKGLDLGMLVRETSGKDALEGKTGLRANLSMRGASADEMKRSLKGTLSMGGSDLVLKGVDLDASLAKIEETQKFDLFDAGSLFVLGPLGPLLTKGVDYAGVAVGGVSKGERSLIAKYSFDWKINGGIASAKDVAFATKDNRVAFDGQLDLANERFVDLTGAVLNSKGCAKFEQTIVGPFDRPTVKKDGIVKSVLKPVTSLLGKAISNGKCKPFYTGSVEHPTP